MEISSDENVIEAPDGSQATYDAEKTAAAYVEFVAAHCHCEFCENFRRAWKSEYLGPSLVAVCAQMGVDPSKPLLVSQVYPSGDLVTYRGQYPFFGEMTKKSRSDGQYPAWNFTTEEYEPEEFAPGLPSIAFRADVPWVLEEPNPYDTGDE